MRNSRFLPLPWTWAPHSAPLANPFAELSAGWKTKPRLDYPPTRFFWFSGPAFHEGIETHDLDGVPVRIYDPEKTVVDCFRYRNQLGMDVVLEALRLWPERGCRKLDVLLKFARMRHVETRDATVPGGDAVTVTNISNIAASVQARLRVAG